MKQGRVFVSHSSNDYSEALEICRTIEGRGVRCAIAPRDVPPGASYADWIGEAIEKASAFVLVLSKTSILSQPVLAELELAFNSLGLPIYPVRIDPIQKSDLPPGIRYFISSKQMIDAIRPLRQNSLDRLSKSIARDLLGVGKAPEQRSRGQVTSEQARIRRLWERMETSNSSLGWFGEAAIGGPLWLFYRGMNRTGFLMVGLLALIVLGTGIAGELESAALVLIFGWIALSLFLGIMGPAMLRRHVSGQANLIGSSGTEAIGPTIVSLSALAAALGLGALIGNPGQATASHESGVAAASVQADQQSSAASSPASANPRKPGDAADYATIIANEERIQKIYIEGQIEGYQHGLKDGQITSDEADSAAEAATDAASAAREAM